MEFIIPGTGTLDIKNILLDYNGTLAVDGKLISGTEERLNSLSQQYSIHVITADTFGSAEAELKNVKCTLIKLKPDNQSEAKLQYLFELGKDNTACIGNGKNDRFMLKESVLGIAVIQDEGIFTGTLMMSDIVCHDILSALEFFVKPKRLIATLRE